MKVFAVYKHGVYRHACMGIFSAYENARQVAAEHALAEDYHNYEVWEYEIDGFVNPPTQMRLDEIADEEGLDAGLKIEAHMPCLTREGVPVVDGQWIGWNSVAPVVEKWRKHA